MIIWDQEGRVVVIISGIRGSVGDWKEIHMGIRMKGEAVDPMVSCCILYILDFQIPDGVGELGRRSKYFQVSWS